MHQDSIATGRPGQTDRKIMIYTGLIYFIAYLIFSLVFLRERFMVDGGYMIFEMANTKTYPGAQNRYIIWVLNILPVSSIKLGLPLKTVMISWIVNYTLFYAICFYTVLLVFKDKYSAWFILFINLFVLGSGFFNIADEITPSATMAIVLYSMWNYYNGWPKMWVMPIAAALLFFTVFGHLLVPLSILMITAYYMLTNWKERKHLVDLFLVPAIVFACLLVMRYTSGLEDNYESGHMAFSQASTREILQTIDLNFLWQYVSFYVETFSVISVMLLIVVIYMILQKDWQRLALIFLLSTGYFLIWYITIYGQFGEVVLSVWFNVPIRWLFPLNFLVLFVFFDRWQAFEAGRSNLRFVLAVIFVIGTLYQFAHLAAISDFPRKTTEQIEVLADQFDVEGQSKYYMDDADKCPFGKYHAVYTNSIVFTAMEGPGEARQFVYATADELDLVLKTPSDVLYLTDDLDFRMSELNRTYFNMSAGEYREMDVNFSDCEYKP